MVVWWSGAPLTGGYWALGYEADGLALHRTGMGAGLQCHLYGSK